MTARANKKSHVPLEFCPLAANVKHLDPFHRNARPSVVPAQIRDVKQRPQVGTVVIGINVISKLLPINYQQASFAVGCGNGRYHQLLILQEISCNGPVAPQLCPPPITSTPRTALAVDQLRLRTRTGKPTRRAGPTRFCTKDLALLISIDTLDIYSEASNLSTCLFLGFGKGRLMSRDSRTFNISRNRRELDVTCATYCSSNESFMGR